MKKLLSFIFLTLMFCNVGSAEKIFNSSLTGLSFSLTDDWNLSDRVSTDKLGDNLSDERKKYIKSIIQKTKVSNFEVLYNEKFVPDIITITMLDMPRNFTITKSNVKRNCKEIMRVNERNIGKKGTLYDCKYIQNKVSKREGALYISYKDDISQEEGEVRVNQIIYIINSKAIYFATSCKDYCKEVTDSIYAISSTLIK
jgi:hypothetical protein